MRRESVAHPAMSGLHDGWAACVAALPPLRRRYLNPYPPALTQQARLRSGNASGASPATDFWTVFAGAFALHRAEIPPRCQGQEKPPFARACGDHRMKRPACVPLSRACAIGTRPLPDTTRQGETQPEKGPAGPRPSETRADFETFDLRGAFCHRHFSARDARHRRGAWCLVVGARRSVLEAPNAELATQGTITACFVAVGLALLTFGPSADQAGESRPCMRGCGCF